MKCRINTSRTLLYVVKSSIGSGMFASLYVTGEDGRETDILDGGRVACARFVSVLLHSVGLIKFPHATVRGTIRDMESSGWMEIERPKPGAVLIWEPDDHDGSVNRHIGFFVGNDLAVSNSTSNKVISEHHWTFGESDGMPARKIEGIYWHEELE